MDLIIGERAHDLAHTDDQAVGRYLASLGDDGACANQTVWADHGVIQNDGLHTDQGATTNGATVKHGLVADGGILMHSQWGVWVNMQDRAFLNVAAGTNIDPRVVCTNAYMGPDAGVGAKTHVTNEHRAVVNPRTGVDCRNKLIKLVYRQGGIDSI